jgi:2Fe-2S ferredoxin
VPKIIYIEPDGQERHIAVRPGMSVMEAAVNNGVQGIIAECGGNCACGTCRVYVAEAWRQVTGQPHDIEKDMIDFIADPDPGLRLSCQLEVTEEMDGLVVRVSPVQR